MKWGSILVQKLKSDCSESFAVCISLQTKAIRSKYRVPKTGKYPPNSGKSSRSWSKSRYAQAALGYSFSLKSVAIFQPTSSKVSVQKVFLSAIHCKARRSGVSLESPGLENIPQVPGNRAELGQNQDACNAVSVTLSVLK